MTEAIGIEFHVNPGIDRKSFIDGVELGLLLKDAPTGTCSPEGTFYKVTMPCGEEYVFNTIHDLPTDTLLCLCGDRSHVVIKWSKNRTPVN